MSLPAILVYSVRGTPAVYGWTGSWTQIGPAIGTVETVGQAYYYGDRVIEHRQTIFLLANGKIYLYNIGGNTWDLQQDLGITANAMGIQRIRSSNGIELIVVGTASGTNKVFLSSDGVTWTEGTAPPTDAWSDPNGRAYVYRNRWFGAVGDPSASIYSYNREKDQWRKHFPGNTPGFIAEFQIGSSRSVAFATYRNDLFAIGWQTDPGFTNPGCVYTLWDEATEDFFRTASSPKVGQSLPAGNPRDIHSYVTYLTSPPGGTGFQHEISHVAAFEANDKLYVLVPGKRVEDFDPGASFDLQDVYQTFFYALSGTHSGGVFPTEEDFTIQLGTLGVGIAGTGTLYGVTAIEDTLTVPGTPEIYFVFEGAGNLTTDPTFFSVHRWDETIIGSTKVSAVHTGLIAAGARAAVPNIVKGGGDHMWTSGDIHVEIINQTVISGGLRLDIILYNAPGPVDKSVVFYFSADEEAPTTQCTLFGTPTVVSGPAAVPTRSGNQINGLEADNTSVYGISWDTVTDSIADTDNATLLARIV